MENKTLGVGLLCTFGVTIMTVIFESGLDYSTAENLYAFTGIAMLFFGIWGSSRLINS